MRQLILSAIVAIGLLGCRTMPPLEPMVVDNPLRVYSPTCDGLWDHLVDVVDDYFDIEREERPRQIGDVMTAGRLDTAPQVGATILEPWRGDSADSYQRVESTLQSIRRRAVVQVIPSDDAYLIDVAVYKELEFVPQPENSPAAAAFRVDNSLIRSEPVVTGQATSGGWIPQGRDAALEQKILTQLLTRINKMAAKPVYR